MAILEMFVIVYCNKWKININTDKIKLCIFERRKSMRNFNFKYRNTVLYVVDTFNYLGITFCCTGNFTTACRV